VQRMEPMIAVILSGGGPNLTAGVEDPYSGIGASSRDRDSSTPLGRVATSFRSE
jgi:hypothetical protein